MLAGVLPICLGDAAARIRTEATLAVTSLLVCEVFLPWPDSRRSASWGLAPRSRRGVDHGKTRTDPWHLWRRHFPHAMTAWRLERSATGAPGLQEAVPCAISVRKGVVHIGERSHVHGEGGDHTARIATAIGDDAEGAHGRQQRVCRLVRLQ